MSERVTQFGRCFYFGFGVESLCLDAAGEWTFRKDSSRNNFCLLVYCRNFQGMQQAKGIRDLERAGRPTIHVLGMLLFLLLSLYERVFTDQDWKSNDQFWKVFGGKDVSNWIKTPHAGGNDDDFWRENRELITLWKYVLCF